VYLIPVQFTARTDNKNVFYFLNTNIHGSYKQGRLVRWQLWLSYFNITFEHVAGINNVFADFLSREFAQHIQDEILVIDQKIKRAEKLIEEKQMKIERLQRKRGKLSTQLKNKTLGPEGLLERFSKSMAEAKEKSRLPSPEPSTTKEDLKDLSQNIPSPSFTVKCDEAYDASLSHKHYTIFNGPNAGCYKDWSTVQPLVHGKPVAYKGYPNYGLARQAFIDYCMKNNISLHTTPTLITPADLLQPKNIPSFADKVRLPPNPVQERTLARFNKISVKNPDSHDFISLETFMHYYRLSEVCNITEGCFISQTNGHRYFNAGEGADPSMVSTLFHCGLLQTICPSANLQEISKLPQGVYTAVKHYRTKVLKEQNRRVLLTLRSSLLDWHETEDEMDCLKNYPAYNFIKIGMLRQIDVTPCTSIKEEVTSNLNLLLPSLRAQSLGKIISKVRKFYKDSMIRVNYQSPHYIIISDSLSVISDQDCKKLQAFEAQFYGNDLEISYSTRRCYCAYGSKDHKCNLCFEKDTPVDPMEEDDNSTDNNM